MIPLIVLVRAARTDDQSRGSMCWRFRNLKLEADEDVSAVMQTRYLNEINAMWFILKGENPLEVILKEMGTGRVHSKNMK